MLDYLAIFTKGGALLWAWQLSALQVTSLQVRQPCMQFSARRWHDMQAMCI